MLAHLGPMELRMNRWIGPWLGLLALGLLAGCAEPDGGCLAAGTCECTSAADCPAGEHCVDGRCRRVTGPELPRRGFGEPCLADGECWSGLCLPQGPGNGGACSRECLEQACPEGWECKARPGPEPWRTACVQRIGSRLCQVCAVDSQCNALGDLCVELAGEFACARDCSFDPCPAGFACSELPTEAGPARQCLPIGGACACTAETLGLTRPCSRANVHGTCHGHQVCQPAEPQPAFGPCDAPEPAAEVCNGRDDDCDGLTDAEDPDIDISGLPLDPPSSSTSVYVTIRL